MARRSEILERPAVKLGAFALVLALAFGGGALAGAAWGPDAGDDPVPAVPGMPAPEPADPGPADPGHGGSHP